MSKDNWLDHAAYHGSSDDPENPSRPTFSHDGQKLEWLEAQLAEARAENERLENLLAEGVHSCSPLCTRPLCVMRRRVEELEAQLEWVPCSERLPDEATPVLVAGKAGKYRYVTTAMVTWEEADGQAGWCWNQLCENYNPDLHDTGNYQFDDDYEYTHWMNLPAPPEDK